MHEFSVAKTILETVAEIRESRRLGPVQRITIELGEFYGVDATLLNTAFEELVRRESMVPPQLEINIAPLEAACEKCDRSFRVIDFRFRCPWCSSGEVHIVRGEELRILRVVAEVLEVVA